MEQQPHLPRGDDDAVRLCRRPAGEHRHRLFPEADAGGKVMGVVLIDGVVGVDQGDVQLLRDAAGQEKGGELTLGMDHVGAPVHQLPDVLPAQGRPQPGAGIDQARRHGADIGHAVLLPGPGGLGQRQDAHLVAPLLQAPAQILHRGHHAVDGGAVPVGGYQNFHGCTSFSLPYTSYTARRPFFLHCRLYFCVIVLAY